MPPVLPRHHVGLIGLGLMGASLAQRLHAAGFEVLCWDIDAARRDAQGGSVATSAAEVFAQCERVLLSLPHLGISGEVLSSVSLRSGQCVIDTGTGDPRQAIELSQ